MRELFKEMLVFLGVVFAPAWLYIGFCLLRGIIDDLRRFGRWLRWRLTRCSN